MNVYEETYLADVLHDIAQGLLVPTMVLIVALIVVSIYFVGRVIAEYFSERRHFKQNMPAMVNDIADADYGKITSIVLESKLLRYQKAALTTVSRNMGLPEEPLFALAQIEINKTEKLYQRRLAWTDTIAKIAPLLGLMGTLIPLGPGIVALGQGDTVGLSQSLLLAFDATVCGLVCAIVALVISKVRSGWYGEYLESLESLMSCVVDKAAAARKDGIQLPANYDGDPMQEFRESDRKGKRNRGGRAGANGKKPGAGAGKAADAPAGKAAGSTACVTSARGGE